MKKNTDTKTNLKLKNLDKSEVRKIQGEERKTMNVPTPLMERLRKLKGSKRDYDSDILLELVEGEEKRRSELKEDMMDEFMDQENKEKQKKRLSNVGG